MADQYELKPKNGADNIYSLSSTSEIDNLKSRKKVFGYIFLASCAVNGILIYNNPEGFYNMSKVFSDPIHFGVTLVQIASIIIPFRIWDNLGFAIKDLKTKK